MTTGSLSRSDLNEIFHVVQSSQSNYLKDLLIGIFRDEFSKDSYYHFVKDEWGFPKTPDLTDMPLEAGYNDDSTTRIFIGEKYRHNVIYYPAILVAMGAYSDVPISINREKETVKYEAIQVMDGYGNVKLYTIPRAFVFAGAFEGSINIDVVTRDILSRDEISDFLVLLLRNHRYEELLRAGLLVKKVNVGGPSESQDRKQEPLYKVTVSIDFRSEWRVEIPVTSTVDAINLCVEFGRVDSEPWSPAPNLTIHTTVNLIDELENI